MPPPSPSEFLGVDVGDARVGIARGSGLARLAEPLTTVPAAQAVDSIKELAAKYHSDAVVVGLPRSLAGKETEQTKKVRAWTAAAKAQLDLPFFWQDEALTSKLAEAADNSKAGSDARAAAIILQDFLDAPEGERAKC